MQSKQEKGFNETQLKQLIEIINHAIDTHVPQMVRAIIQEEVNPRPDRIEQRLERINLAQPLKKNYLKII